MAATGLLARPSLRSCWLPCLLQQFSTFAVYGLRKLGARASIWRLPLLDVATTKTGLAFRSETRHGLVARLTGILFSGYAFLFYFFLYAPILLLVLFSFNESRFPTNWTGFSLEWYEKLFGNYAMGQALKNSLIVTFTSTAIATGYWNDGSGGDGALGFSSKDYCGWRPCSCPLSSRILQWRSCCSPFSC